MHYRSSHWHLSSRHFHSSLLIFSRPKTVDIPDLYARMNVKNKSTEFLVPSTAQVIINSSCSELIYTTNSKICRFSLRGIAFFKQKIKMFYLGSGSRVNSRCTTGCILNCCDTHFKGLSSTIDQRISPLSIATYGDSLTGTALTYYI